MFGLTVPQILGLSVIGAVVSAVGSIAGVIIKDYFFSRSFEMWKQKVALRQLYEKFRDPLLLSAQELASRILEIVDEYPTVFLRTEVVATSPQRQIENSTDDPYFRRYKLVSTLYRFCSFLGWLELFRQEIAFLHPGDNRQSLKIDQCVASIRSALADGHINTADDWDNWRDTLVFREELRAIGEVMIETRGSARNVIGYGKFCELFDSTSPSETKQWAMVAMNFFLDLETTQRDFRLTRLQLLLIHLVEFLECVSTRPVQPRLLNARERLRG